MDFKRLIVFLVILSMVTAIAWGMNSSTSKQARPGASLILDKNTFLWINSILCMVHNNGSFAYDDAGFLGKTDGLYFPFASPKDNKTVIYSAGIWVGAKVNNQIRVAIAEYSSEYTPGPMTEDGEPAPDDASYRVYKIGAGTNLDGSSYDDAADRAAWPAGDGAPVDDMGDPDQLGNQMCWAVYNDADPAGHQNMITDPLGVEIQQSTFGFAAKGPLDNVIFLKYTIINKGSNQLDSMYISLWADPDVGDASDDLVGCDTALSLGFCYNEGADAIYGVPAPAVGFDFFQGPIVPSQGDTAVIPGSDPIPDHKVLGMTSFNKYINGTDPQNAQEVYNYMSGLNRDGTVVVDPNGDTTKYFVPGDPVDPEPGVDWLDEAAADRRYMMSTGPFVMAPGDTQVVLAAVLAAQGTNNLQSIKELKRIDEQAQLVYDLNFQIPQPPPNPNVFARGYDQAIELVWDDAPEGPENYFEDFRRELQQLYVFEGYNIYMGESQTGPWEKIATIDFDAGEMEAMYSDSAGPYYGCVWDEETEEFVCDTDNVRTWDFQVLYEDRPDPVTGKTQRVVVQPGSNAGLSYSLRFDKDPRDGSVLLNMKPYYFAVTSYSVNIEQVAASDSVFFGPNFGGLLAFNLENRITPITVKPAGSAAILEQVAEHTAGTSDGSMSVEYLVQDSITGHAYETTFFEVMEGDHTVTKWRLTDVTTGEVVLDNQTNQTGDYNYPIVHGIMPRPMGPDPGIRSINEIANSTGPISPDNVMYSLNSTGDWYLDADVHGEWDRLNWRGLIGIDDWEFRFTEDGSQYYNYLTDELYDHRAPFEVWNIGPGTPDDESDDVQVYFMVIDDDESGGWSYGDRIYVVEQPYSEPMPEMAEYTWDDDFHIGRIVIHDYSGATEHPEVGTIIKFTTNKPNDPNDVYSFRTKPLGTDDGTVIERTMENIIVWPNPYYNYTVRESNQFDRELHFSKLPAGVVTTVRIFNVAGDLLRTLTHNGGAEHDLVWDLKTEAGLPVASGMYVWLAESELGQKFGKMAVFTEVEQLNTY